MRKHADVLDLLQIQNEMYGLCNRIFRHRAHGITRTGRKLRLQLGDTDLVFWGAERLTDFDRSRTTVTQGHGYAGFCIRCVIGALSLNPSSKIENRCVFDVVDFTDADASTRQR